MFARMIGANTFDVVVVVERFEERFRSGLVGVEFQTSWSSNILVVGVGHTLLIINHIPPPSTTPWIIQGVTKKYLGLSKVLLILIVKQSGGATFPYQYTALPSTTTMTPWIIRGVTGKCFGLSKVLLTNTIYDDNDTLDHPRYFAYQRSA